MCVRVCIYLSTYLHYIRRYTHKKSLVAFSLNYSWRLLRGNGVGVGEDFHFLLYILLSSLKFFMYTYTISDHKKSKHKLKENTIWEG